jgi:FMN phosphatase YigB (HAD superfamily)
LTDGDPSVQRRKVTALGPLAEALDTVVLTGELGPGNAKPSPVPFELACRLLDVPPDHAVYVGNDPRKDFIGARLAGLTTVRAGSLPDFGGPLDIRTVPADDADIAVDSFASLSDLLSVTLPKAHTR